MGWMAKATSVGPQELHSYLPEDEDLRKESRHTLLRHDKLHVFHRRMLGCYSYIVVGMVWRLTQLNVLRNLCDHAVV